MKRGRYPRYDNVAASLRPVWELFSSTRPVEVDGLSKLAYDFRAAKSYEEAGIQQPKDFLRKTS